MSSPDIAALATSLADVAIRNTASVIFSRLASIRGRNNDREAIDLLTELVNELIADKAELVSIAQAFEQELVSQRISADDIDYITGNVIPLLERFSRLAGDQDDLSDTVEALKALVTVETVTIMQLVGFNYRKAIGEPLTTLVERLITSRVPQSDVADEVRLLNARREVAYLQAIQIPEARNLLQG